MKTFRLVTTVSQIDISMPTWLFWFFKRFSHVKTSPHVPGLKGLDFDCVMIDEAGE